LLTLCRWLAPLAAAGTLHAATLDVEVRDFAGAPVADAVVHAYPKAGPAAFRKRDAAVEQLDKTFVPLVSVVQTGTSVQFPNRDPIRHHVYSFSPPKPFELKLYSGTPAAPVVFDKPGEVVLGCNIHDHMIAYVLVVDTPWFAKTGKDGKAKIDGLPAGDYEVRLWHFALALPVPEARQVKLRADETAPSAWKIGLRALPPKPAR
jgi:plastocyanin